MARDDEELLRSAAMQDVQGILQVRHRADEELVHAKKELEAQSAKLARALAMMRATLNATCREEFWDRLPSARCSTSWCRP